MTSRLGAAFCACHTFFADPFDVWSTDSFTQVADVNRLLSMLPLIYPRFYPLGGPMKNFKSIELIAAEFLE